MNYVHIYILFYYYNIKTPILIRYAKTMAYIYRCVINFLSTEKKIKINKEECYSSPKFVFI